MKKLKLTFLLLFIFLIKINGQENSTFVDGILIQMAKDELTIFNEELEIIPKEEIWNEIVWVDTVVNDMWFRPKVIDNVFRKGFDGATYRTEEILDTATYEHNPRFIKFTKRIHDDNGNFLYVRTVFLIDRLEEPKKKKTKKLKRRQKRILNKRKSFWTNSTVIISHKKIALDSCHSLYQLTFYKDFTFTQKYNHSNFDKCYTDDMKHDRDTGLEGDNEFFNLFNQLQGHYIDHPNGTWTMKNNQLILKAKGGQEFLRFEILKIKKRKLHLQPIGVNQEIILKKNFYNN